MDFNEIATVSGKGGLFRVLKPSRSGVVLESLDAEKKRFMAGPSQRISVLNEISIFTTNEEGSVPLQDVMRKIYAEFDDDPGVDANSDGEELKAFLKHILPDFDEDRVYTSDIKKLLKWYFILRKEAPELLKEGEQQPEPIQESGEGGESKPDINEGSNEQTG